MIQSMLHCLIQMNFPMLIIAHDIICRDNTVPVTTHEIKHYSWKKKWGKHSSTKTGTLYSGVPVLGVASWRHQQTHSSPPSQWLRESNSISPPHVSSHLPWINRQSVFPQRRVSSGAEILFADVQCSPKGEKMVVVTLNECSKVAERYRSNAKPQRCSFPSSAHFQCLRVTSLAITDRCPQDYFLTCRACFPIVDNPH